MQQLKTIDAFRMAANLNLNAANYWLTKITSISQSEIHGIFREIPRTLISEPASEFAVALLEANKKRLIESMKND